MAISTSYEGFKKDFNPNYWKSYDEFIEYKLLSIAEQGSFYHNYYTDQDGVEKHIPPIDHFPILKEYEVWMEGYAATGESGGAHLVGKVSARNFSQACHILMCRQYMEHVEKINNPAYSEYTDPGRWDYDPSRKSYWGCRLYWNEHLAKKSFG